jgi:hypothetical protein
VEGPAPNSIWGLSGDGVMRARRCHALSDDGAFHFHHVTQNLCDQDVAETTAAPDSVLADAAASSSVASAVTWSVMRVTPSKYCASARFNAAKY